MSSAISQRCTRTKARVKGSLTMLRQLPPFPDLLMLLLLLMLLSLLMYLS
jgi:hypothetical protein